METSKWIHVAMSWKRGISGELKTYANGDKKFENFVDGNGTLDFMSSGRSVHDIGLLKRSGETIHAFLSDLVIFNRELSENELKAQWVRSHPLYNFI